jgi:hypothetical protein
LGCHTWNNWWNVTDSAPITRKDRIQVIHSILAGTKGLGEDIVADVGCKYLVGRHEKGWELGIEGVEANGQRSSHILLKVQEASRKYKHITLLQGFAEQFVVMAHKTSGNGALHHIDGLSSQWVGMEGNHTPRFQVQSHVWDTLCVEPWVVSHQGKGDYGIRAGYWCVSCNKIATISSIIKATWNNKSWNIF